MLLRRAASSSAFVMVLRVTPATCPWTPQTSGLHVYCTSTRTTTQKYKLKLTHSLRRKGYGVGPTQKYKSALSALRGIFMSDFQDWFPVLRQNDLVDFVRGGMSNGSLMVH